MKMSNLTKDQFKRYIEMLREEYIRGQKFNDALQEFAGDRDFTGYFKGNDKLVSLLEDLMMDSAGWISWWMFEQEYGTKCKKDSVQSKEGKNIPSKTMEDLYNLIVNKQ